LKNGLNIFAIYYYVALNYVKLWYFKKELDYDRRKSSIMTFEERLKYLKTGKFTLYKMAR